MDAPGDLPEEEFVRFLQGLGVETYKLSFGWMFNDPDFAGVIKWIYDSLDHNNALSAREEFRYDEIRKKGALLPLEDLEDSVSAIQQQYPGICLPGDQESKEDVELEIQFLEERLNVLEKHETGVQDLIMKNLLLKEQLTQELTQLNSTLGQYIEDRDTAAEECLKLAQEVEALMDGVVQAVGENLDVYTNCKGDKELARRFMTFSPVESYRQSQALFRSHHELFVSRRLGSDLHRVTEELQAATADAADLEDRLTAAALAYIKSKADLSGEQAKLALVANYDNVHPNQITNCLLEARSTLELLEQEENIAEQQVRSGVDELVKSRTDLAVGTAAAAALDVRLQVHSSLSQLVTAWQQASALDKILYYCLRRELSTLEDATQFAVDLRQYAAAEGSAVAVRIDSMKEICSEHTAVSQKLQSANPVLQALCTLLGVPPTNDPSVVLKAYHDLQANIRQLEQNVDHGIRKKEGALFEIRESAAPLRSYIWSGCTRQAHCWDAAVASLSRSLAHQIEAVDKKVLEASGLFTRVKTEDKKNLRKLWQWFLTDQPRFLTAVKNCSL